jgi:hypothetical protein
VDSQSEPNHTGFAAAVVVVAVVLAVGVTTYLVTTPAVTKTQSLSGICLKEVPVSAVIGNYYNSTSQGYTATYSNGTKQYFPLGSCPVPVPPENYRVDSIIEANPKFIAAEKGSVYEATNLYYYGACNCAWGGSSSNSTGQYAVFNWVSYSSQRVYPCGPSSFWTFEELGLILITIPVNSTGGLQFSNAVFQSLLGNNAVSCTTLTT